MKAISIKIFFIILSQLMGAATAFGQGHSVSGTVTDGSTGETMPGVNIRVRGTTTGTSTDPKGQYELSVESLQDTLVFSFVGYAKKEVPINGQTEINVKIKIQAISGQEMVVVGYGKQKEETLTGSISHVKGEELAKSPTQSLSNTFAGNIVGVTAMNRSGEPGADVSSLLIRGKSTLGNNDPLIVIDGVAGREGLNQIDPDNIESISVLKDASAAIYGARAANGVILITTKRGAVSKPTVNYTFNQGITQPTNLPNMADAASYAGFYNQVLANEGQPARFSKEDIQKFRNGRDPQNYPNTDWVRETLKNYSTQSEHNLSIQGGTETVRYFLAGNLKNANSIFRNGITHYRRTGGRANIDVDATDFIKVSLDFSAHYGNRKRPSVSTGVIMNSMWRNYPFTHARYKNGLPAAGIERGENPIVMVTDEPGYRKNKTDRYKTKINIDTQIPGIEGLSLNGFLAYDKNLYNYKRWQKPWTVYNYDSATDTYNKKVGGSISEPELEQQSTTDIHLSTNAKISYKRQFGDHSIEPFIAFGYKKDSNNFFSAERQHFISNAIDQLFAGSSVNQITDGSASTSKRAYFIGRLSYNFKEKYLVDFNFRYDGSSNFPEDHRWGFFPGVSVAWRVSKEKFFKKSADWLTNLKFRASVGIMGNDRIPAHQYLATYSFTTGAFFGPNLEPNTGLTSNVLPNPFITWEKQRTMNLGLDVNLWRGALGFKIDVFKNKRNNILTSRNAAIPAYTAMNLPDENIGVVKNRGFELEISHQQVMQNFNFSIGGNVSYAKDKIVNISEPANVPDYQRREGKPLGTRLLYKAIGIFKSQKEINNNPSVPGANVGDLRYKDINGDGAITGDDRFRTDYTSTPQITFGFNTAIGYKNFTFSMLWQGVTKVRRYFQLQSGTGGNMVQEIVKYSYTYTQDPNAKYPNVGTQSFGYPSDFWYMNASFVRLKNAKINYNLPEKFFSEMGVDINNLAIYISGEDLLTFSKFDWFDPEGEPLDTQSFYPPNRIFNLGISIKF